MRVKEGTTGSSEMGKKRNRTKQTDYHNTSDEETTKGKGCSHLDKSVSLTSVKRGLKNIGIGQCSQCTNDKGGGGSSHRASAGDEIDGEVFEPVIWLCLQCGNQGCCRNSPAQHALKHFETPRSGAHALAVCLDNWAIWCYKCDDSINPVESKKLGECMDWIKKQAMQQRTTERPSGKKKGKEVDGDDTHIRSSSSPLRSPLLSRDGPLPKVKGLTNLGNTCFFNAVMQNLTQTHVLRSLLHEKWSSGKQLEVPLDTHLSVSTNQNGNGRDADKEQLPAITITVTALQPLTSALIEFLDEMHKPTKSLTLNPRPLFNQVCNKASRFKGYQQQDSHELLRYLLDGMKAEEIKRMQGGLQVTFDVKKSKIKNMDEATKKRIKEYGNHSKHTFVDTVFGGHLISSVKCNECHNISEILEPFLDLSLPIVEAKGSKRNLSSSKSIDKPAVQTSEQQAASDCDRSAGAAGAAGAVVAATLDQADSKPLSKHQLQKQKEKSRKESRRKTRRSRTASQSEDPDPTQEKKDSPIQSENEEELREGTVSYRDPNDADSEASNLDRLSNAGSSRRCSEQTAGSELGFGSLPSTLPEVTPERENEEAKGVDQRTERQVNGEERTDVRDKVGCVDRLSFSSRASTSSSTSSRLSPLPNRKALGDEQSGTTDEERKNLKEERRNKERTMVKEEGSEKTLAITKLVRNKMAMLSLDDSGKDVPEVNGVLDDPDESAADCPKESSNSDACREEGLHHDADPESQDAKAEKNPGGSDRTVNGPPAGIAPLAKIHELGETIGECNHVDAKKERNGTVVAAKGNVAHSVSTKVGSSKPNAGKTKPQPISTQAASKLQVTAHNATSPPVSPVSPTSKVRVASTLAPRYQSKNQECSVMSCLTQFTAPELLTGSNRFGCETCSKTHKEEGKHKLYTDASKQLLIHQPPPILTLHLKRFQQIGYSLRKITRHIDFPMTLDVAPFCSSACKTYANSDNRVLYSLYGVIEHSGRLQFGHYTAFVKVRQTNQKLNHYTLGIPRTLNILNEQHERSRAERGDERSVKERSRLTAKRNDETSDCPSGENSERKAESQQQNKTSNSANNGVPERNHIQSPVLPFHAGRNVSTPSGRWYYVSDTHVTEVNETKVLQAQAYILFYERLV